MQLSAANFEFSKTEEMGREMNRGGRRDAWASSLHPPQGRSSAAPRAPQHPMLESRAVRGRLSPLARVVVAVTALAGCGGCVLAGGSPSLFPCLWDAAPTSTPSITWPDGPIMGNGNMGVAVGGGHGTATLYVAVNGFWGAANGTNSSMPPLEAGSASGAFTLLCHPTRPFPDA